MRDMKRAALVFGLLTCAVPRVQAQGGLATWNRLDVVARLDNDGRLEVAETHEIKLQGDVAVISRPFNRAADQSITVHGVFRLEPDGTRTPLRIAPVEGADAYQVYGWGLQFSLKGDHDPAFDGVVTRRYAIEYELVGALTPAWDMAAGQHPLDRGTSPRNPLDRAKEVWAGWREAWPEIDSHYRLDHDVLFPTGGLAGGLAELNYRLEYGTAWVLVDKDRDIGVATPDVDYRVQRVLRYLPEGRPREVDVRRAGFRLTTLAAPLILGLLFGLLFIATDHLSHPSPRGDRALFESRVASLPKELIQDQLGDSASAPSFQTFLLRMAAQKKIAISIESQATDETDAKVRLRLTADRAKLSGFEREVVQEIFGTQDTVSTADIQDRFRGERFRPDRVVNAAFAKLRSPGTGKVAKSRPLWSALHLAFMAGGVALMVKSLADQSLADPAPLFAGIVPGNILVSLWPTGSSRRRPGILTIAIGILVLGLLGAALALSPNTPLSGLAALGLTVLSTGHCVGLLARLPKLGPAALELEAARRWAMAELRKPRPDLRDTWVDALEALGGRRALARWKARYGGSFGGGDLGEMGPMDLSAGPPFTGEPPKPPTLPGGWIYGFSVPGDNEGDDDDDEEDDRA
jgi:hypothetical protein